MAIAISPNTPGSRHGSKSIPNRLVRDMFRWLIEQLTTRQIVKRLNALKIPTRTGQNPVWHAASVRCMLNNPIYTGQGITIAQIGRAAEGARRTFHPRTDNYAREPRPLEEWVPITAPAIISAETFAKAQEQLKQNQGKPAAPISPRRSGISCGRSCAVGSVSCTCKRDTN